jgi:phage terminase small subunit
MIGRHIDVQAFREKVDVHVTNDLAEVIAKRRRRRADAKP